MMRHPGEIKTAPASSYLPRCPGCGERYLGDGVTPCVDCEATRAAAQAITRSESAEFDKFALICHAENCKHAR